MPPAADVVVGGAGVFGLTIALRLARAGRSVRVLEQTSDGTCSASAVAAGMLAPVSETLAEHGDLKHLRRLMLARDLWPAFAADVPGIALDASGVELEVVGTPVLQSLRAELLALGIDGRVLAAPRCGVAVAEDWRLDAPVALAALRAALKKLGVRVEAAGVTVSLTGALLANQAAIEAEHVVIAAGYGARALAAAAPELAELAPIKGQLVAFSPGGGHGVMLRGEGVYVVPQCSGTRAGATMEVGLSDVDVVSNAIERMRDAALTLSPELAGLSYRGEAGVRAATPDGWPLVGASATPGLLLAVGARRNGWLLAPLVSQMICDGITGAAPHPQIAGMADAFHPGRFTR